MHAAKINGILRVSENEIISCSDDMSLKVWDTFVDGCSYTIETDEKLSAIGLTCEKLDTLITSSGDGNFIVYNI